MAKRTANSQIANLILTIEHQESPWFPCVQVEATYHWKDLDEGYKFSLDLISIRGLLESYGPPKLQKSQFRGFRDSNLGILGQNDIWVLVPWLGTENTIRGKVMASPKFGPWWVLWVCVYSWLVCAPKMFQLCTNQLVIWFV